MAKVRELLQQVGVDPKKFVGHSFQTGAATIASRQGISEATIKMLGQWESAAYLLYNRQKKRDSSICGKLLLAHL